MYNDNFVAFSILLPRGSCINPPSKPTQPQHHWWPVPVWSEEQIGIVQTKFLPLSLLKPSFQSLQSVWGSGHHCQSVVSKILNTLQLPHEIVGFSNVQTTVDGGTLFSAPNLHAHKLQATKNKCVYYHTLTCICVPPHFSVSTSSAYLLCCLEHGSWVEFLPLITDVQLVFDLILF